MSKKSHMILKKNYRFNCTDEDVLAQLDYLKPPIVGLKKTRSIATIQYDCDFLVAINHFINNGFTRPDIMSSKVLQKKRMAK